MASLKAVNENYDILLLPNMNEKLRHTITAKYEWSEETVNDMKMYKLEYQNPSHLLQYSIIKHNIQ